MTFSVTRVVSGLGDYSLNLDRVMYQLSNGGDYLLSYLRYSHYQKSDLEEQSPAGPSQRQVTQIHSLEWVERHVKRTKSG